MRCIATVFDWNPHSPGALITETEDALAVADDDDLNVIVPRMTDDAAYVVLARNTQKQPARLAKDLAEMLATQPDRGRVDDRHHLFDIAR
jgi:hypothetical protein